MEHNLKQLNETLDTVESVPERAGNPPIIHVHLKSGSSVNDSVFRNFPLETKIIHALGRAKDFPSDETEMYADQYWIPKFIFRPNGDLVWQDVKNGNLCLEKMNNIFKYQNGPKISPARLFVRRHILSHFR